MAKLFLWPGTKICEWFGVDPTGDAVLIRWMFNTLFYLFVALAIIWLVAV
jgi:hypothetical protein